MPLNAPINITGAAKKVFKPLPKDAYAFELIDINLISEKGFQTEELVDKLKFEFACLEEDNGYYGRRIWQTTTLKLVDGQKPSGLFTLLTGVRNIDFTKEELKAPGKFLTNEFLTSLIGTQLRLSLGLKPSPDGSVVYNKIESFLPAKQKFPAFDKEKSKKLGEQAMVKQEVAPAPTETSAPQPPPF